jgi:hypothetical protein
VTDSKVEDSLHEFLQWTERERREGYTIANVLLAMDALAKQSREAIKTLDSKIEKQRLEQQVEMEGVKERLDEHQARILRITRRVRKGSHDFEMDTGNFDLLDIKKEIEQQRAKRVDSERVRHENAVWWKRTVVLWVAAICATLLVATLTFVASLVVSGASLRLNRAAAPPSESRP